MTRQVCCECPFVGSARKKSRSRDAIRTRVLVTGSNKTTKRFALRVDLRQRVPAVDTGILTIRALSSPKNERTNGRKQGSGTPRDAYPTSAPMRLAAPAERCALDSRRPTTALAAASERHSSPPATRFLGRD